MGKMNALSMEVEMEAWEAMVEKERYDLRNEGRYELIQELLPDVERRLKNYPENDQLVWMHGVLTDMAEYLRKHLG